MYLPLGWKVLNKINAIMKNECYGGQEISLRFSATEIWQQTGRWDAIGVRCSAERLTDRDIYIGMTHEEIIFVGLRDRSTGTYRSVVSIQTKLRDEARARAAF
jgi:prolyl-tRNA synthetase